MRLVLKCLALSVFVGGLCLVGPLTKEVGAQNRDQEIISNRVLPYFAALKAGDVRSLRTYVAGKLGRTLRKLLWDNPTYPQFLRKQFGGATIVVTNTRIGKRMLVTEVRMTRPNKEALTFEVRVRQNSRGEWKVVDQVLTD